MDKHNRYREEELEQEKTSEDTENSEVEDEAVEEVKPGEIEALQEEVKTLKEQLLRNRADLENFKRRTNEERIKERKYALQDILTELVEIIDLFDSVINMKTDDEKLKNFLFGFKMISDRYKQVLENYGVKKIEALNQKFDYTVHQAMEEEINNEVEDGTVIKVISNGYMYKDRVLKPSMVIVSKKEEK